MRWQLDYEDVEFLKRLIEVASDRWARAEGDALDRAKRLWQASNGRLVMRFSLPSRFVDESLFSGAGIIEASHIDEFMAGPDAAQAVADWKAGNRFCQFHGCETKLTGKQQKWCDAHRWAGTKRNQRLKPKASPNATQGANSTVAVSDATALNAGTDG